MRSLLRISGGVVVILAAAIVNGCGASPTADQQTISDSHVAYEASTEAITSPHSLSNNASTALPDQVSALKIANVWQDRFSRDKESGALMVRFSDLNLKSVLGKESITAEDVKGFPNWLSALNGEKIRIRGYMLPTFDETGIERFVLDHSPRSMNFGADPKTYELIQVDLVAGTTTNSVRSGQSIEVTGRFRINFDAQDGTIPMLYFLEDAIVVVPKADEGTERMSPISALKISNASPKTFSMDEETGSLNVTFADLNLKGIVGREQISEADLQLLPDWLDALNGKKIRVQGYMFPGFDDTGIERFILDHSPRPLLTGFDFEVYESLWVNLAAGTSTNYVPATRSMDVVGVFRIAPEVVKGVMFNLYFLDDAFVVADQQNQKAP